MEKKWSSNEDVMEFVVQRWMSVDEDDGDVVREVAAQCDKQHGIELHLVVFLCVGNCSDE